MMNKLVSLVVVSALGSIAFSADGAKPFSVSIGLGNYANKTAKNFTRASGLAFGLGYKMATKPMIAPGRETSGIDLTYFDTSKNGNRNTNWGLTFGPQVFLDKSMTTYGTFGVGVYSSRLTTAPAAGNARPSRAPAAGTSETVTRFGAKLGLGYQTMQGIFIEANYHILGKRQGIDLNHTTIMVGFKF